MPKYNHRIWYHKSILLASIPALEQELYFLEKNPIIDFKNIKELQNLIFQYKNLLNKDL